MFSEFVFGFLELALLKNYNASRDGGIFVFLNRKIVIQVFAFNTVEYAITILRLYFRVASENKS
jgi:hypothetical protein